MQSFEVFGSNGIHDLDGGLIQSPLKSAWLNTPLEDNSALLGLTREVRPSAASDPLASQLDRLETLDTTAASPQGERILFSPVAEGIAKNHYRERNFYR